MKIFKLFFLLFVSLSCSGCAKAQCTTTSTSDIFHPCLDAIQNHSLTRIGSSGDAFKICLNFPCLIVGGYQATNTGAKTVWSAAATYAHWDTMATIESKNGALRAILDLHARRLSEDLLFMPGQYNLDWYNLTGNHLPAGATLAAFGVTVLIFSPAPVP